MLVRVGYLEDAEKAYGEVLRLGQSNNDNEAVAIAYGNLGNVYSIRGDLDQAEVMYRKSLALFQEIGAVLKENQVQEWLDSLAKERELLDSELTE